MEMRTGLGGVRPRSRPSKVKDEAQARSQAFLALCVCNQNCSKYPQGVGRHFPDRKPRLSWEAKPQKDVWSSKAEGEAREEAAQQAGRNGGTVSSPHRACSAGV